MDKGYENALLLVTKAIDKIMLASSRAASPYKCKECELAFSSQQDLEEHNRRIH
jgi:uncharacterized Zn-finger protein